MMQSNEKLISCEGCGGLFPAIEGPTHKYMESSPGCWAMYGEVLAREYSDFRYMKVHRLTVDSYAVQHPRNPSPQNIRSVVLHLVSLCAVIEEQVEMQQATKIIQQLANEKKDYDWLFPPTSMGKMTVGDVYRANDAQEHIRMVKEWAQSSWMAWSHHHDRIRTLLIDIGVV